jgi:hypothetical protein
LIVVVIVLGYSLLTLVGIVPFYALWARDIGVPSLFLLLALYVNTVLLCSVVWYLWVLHPNDSINAQLAWRGVYRQTDRIGVWWQGILLALVVGVVAYFALPAVREEYREAVVYLAIVVNLPMLSDLFPPRRLRRIVASPDDRSALDIAERIMTSPDQNDHVLNSIALYNELDPKDPKLAGPDLPDGMIIEIPPSF